MKETDFPPLEPQPFVTEEGREIQRLRAELAAAIKQRDEACQRTYNAGFVEASRIHGIEIQQLRKQRDEARREACLWALPQGVAWNEAMIARGKAIASERGWDCFAQGGGA